MTRPFCPKCGKETNELIEGFCIECYTGKKRFVEVPELVKLNQCKYCNSVFLKSKWCRFDLQKIKEYIRSKISVNLLKDAQISLSFPEKSVNINVEGSIGKKTVEKEFEVPLKINFVTCDACMKKAADYWEVKVQLRKAKHFDYDSYSKIEKELYSRADAVKHTKQGPDFYFVSRSEVKDRLKGIEKHYHLHAPKSKKFAGFTKQQAKKIKYTYCFRV